jgi:hypothetical protein
LARAGEVKAIAALLEQEHPDVDALAKAVINALDQERADRVDWCVVTWMGPTATVYGPWPGEKSAQKALSTGKIPMIDGMSARVLRFYGLSAMERTWARVDAPAPKAEVVTIKRGLKVDDTKTHMTHVEEIKQLVDGEWRTVARQRPRSA